MGRGACAATGITDKSAALNAKNVLGRMAGTSRGSPSNTETEKMRSAAGLDKQLGGTKGVTRTVLEGTAGLAHRYGQETAHGVWLLFRFQYQVPALTVQGGL